MAQRETDSRVLVLGGTSKTGRRLTTLLRDGGVPVRSASRAGETIFDWTRRETWAPILAGVATVYLVPPDDPSPTADFVSQAVDAGVRYFVTLSGRGVEHIDGRFGQGMAAAEAAVRSSGVAWTILRPNNFFQNFDEGLWLGPLRSGRLGLPVAGVLEPFIDAADVAAVAAATILSPGHNERIYELSGPHRLSFSDVVAVISRAAGRSIRFDDLTPEEYRAELRSAGTPEPDIDGLDSLFGLYRAGHLTQLTGDVLTVLGRGPNTLEAWAVSAATARTWDQP